MSSQSTAQKLWNAARVDPASSYFNIPVAFRLQGPLDTDAVEHAFNSLVRRHDTLRTVFEETDGRVVKKVLRDVKLRLARHMVAPSRERERDVAMLLAAEADTPFDLATGPLLRAGLVILSERDHVLFLTIHHAIFDQWSGAVLFQELSALYEAHAGGTPCTLDPEPTQYAACARQQAEWLSSADHERQLQYWKAQLRGPLRIIEMPGRPPSPDVSNIGATHWFELPIGLGREVAAAIDGDL